MKNHLVQDNNDFYIDNGLVVFTEEYHLKRGYCCKNKCKHCPYKKKAQLLNTTRVANCVALRCDRFHGCNKNN